MEDDSVRKPPSPSHSSAMRRLHERDVSDDTILEIVQRHETEIEGLRVAKHAHAGKLTALEFMMAEQKEHFDTDLIIKIDRTHLVTEDIKKLVWVIVAFMVPAMGGLAFALFKVAAAAGPAIK